MQTLERKCPWIEEKNFETLQRVIAEEFQGKEKLQESFRNR